MDQATRQTRSSFRFLFLVLIVAIPLHAPNAHADCAVGDIACYIQALITPVEKDVKKLEKDVGSLGKDIVPPLQKELKSVQDGLNQFETDFTNLSTESAAVITQFKGTIDAVKPVTDVDKFFGFSDDLVNRLTEGFKHASQEIEHDSEAYQSFVGTNGCSATCIDFRQRAADVVRRVGTTTELTTGLLESQLLSATGVKLSYSRTVDTGGLADKLEGAPGIALFPLYVLMNAPPSASRSAGATSEVWATLPVTGSSANCSGANYCGYFNSINGLLDQIESTIHSLESAQQKGLFALANCDIYGDTQLGPYAEGLFVGGNIALILASYMESAGLSGLDLAVQPGIDAGPAADAAFNERPVRQLGHLIRMLGKPCVELASFFKARQRACAKSAQASMVLCAMEAGNPNFRDDCRSRVLAGEVFGF